MKDQKRDRTSSSKNDPRTLAIYVGGTGLKASVLDGAEHMMVERVRIDTPNPCPEDSD